MTEQILVIPKLLNTSECETLIQHYEISNRESHYEQSGNALTGEIKKSNFKVKEVEPNSDAYKLAFLKIENALKIWIKHLEKFNSYHTIELTKHLNFPHQLRILKYDIGEFIHPHIDRSRYGEASCTLNLNDDYTGGKFSFFNKKYEIELGKGDALVFPNSWFWVHEVTPIITGTRYSLNTFILAEPRHAENLINTILRNIKSTNKFNLF